MRIAMVLCLVFPALVAPAYAAPFDLSWQTAGGASQYWGRDFVTSFNYFSEVESASAEVFGPLTAVVTGTPTLQSHELVNQGQGSRATYTGGFLEIRDEWGSDADQLGALLLRVAILELVIDVSEYPDLDIVFGDMYFTLGQGQLAADFARQLRVPRRIIGGEYWIGMDYVGPPFSELGEAWEREGSWNGTELDITVPEPATVTLLTIAFAVTALGRGKRSFYDVDNRRREGGAEIDTV